MLLKQLTVLDFRNFNKGSFYFNPFLTIIISENAKGKTNLLEAIHFLIQGTGFRESREGELIHLGQDKCYVSAKFGTENQTYQFEVKLNQHEDGVAKIFFVNKTKKNSNFYHEEITKAVLFSPAQIEILTGTPDRRRKYFDRILSSCDLEYKKRLINYENALRKRNRILEHYRDADRLKEELSFWNLYLQEQATYIAQTRGAYVEYLNRNRKVDDREFEIEYLKNELTQVRLEEKFEEEKRFRRTLIGPQKDDFAIFERNGNSRKNLQHFGSRSEQRLGIFWLKLGEIRYFEKIFKKKPILLLDDIFSELDFHNKKLILDLIKGYQTVVTTTEIKLLDLSDMPKSIIKL